MTFNAGNSMNSRKVIEANMNGTLTPLLWIYGGDSLNTGVNGIAVNITSAMTNMLGYAGTISGPGTSLQQFTFTGGASYVTGDFARWYSGYANIPNGGTVTIAPSSGSFSGNVLVIGYYQTNGAGTINIQTNLNGGAFATWQSLNTDNSGAASGDVLFLTNSAGALPTQMKLVGTSGTTIALLLGIMNTTSNGFTVCDQAVDGQNVAQFMTVPTNVWARIYGKLHAHGYIYKCTDTAAQVAANFPGFLQSFTNVCTNTDFTTIGVPPMGTATTTDDDVLLQNQLYYGYMRQINGGYLDGYGMFLDHATGLQKGFLYATNDVNWPHLTAAGNQFQTDAFFTFLNLFDGSFAWWNAPYSKTVLFDKNFSHYASYFFVGEGNTHVLGFLSGTKNMQYYLNPTVGYHQMVWDDQGSGAGPALVFGYSQAANVEELAPHGSLSGALFAYLGRMGGMTFNTAVASNVYAYAGLSTNAMRVGGTLFTNLVSTGNGAGTLTTLYTNMLMKSTFVLQGDTLKIVAAGDYGATANADKTLVLWLGNGMVFSNRQAINAGQWTLYTEITYTASAGSTNYECQTTLGTTTAGIQASWRTNVTSWVTNSLTPMGLWLTGNGTSASEIVGKRWRAEWWGAQPAPP